MFNIIPLIIILISLSIIIVIVVRKFSALANLDVDNMPAEKEARFKERLIGERMKRNFLKWNFKLKKGMEPVMENASKAFSALYEKLGEIKEKNAPLKSSDSQDLHKKINSLYEKAEEHLREDDISAAEKELIEIIGYNPKDRKAFKMLAELYFDKKSYEEACQTYEHVLRLIDDEKEGSDEEQPDLSGEKAEVHFEISLACREMERWEKAVKHIESALEIDPKNPRFLDTLLEISIIKKDKDKASEVFERLKNINPENGKLPELEERIKTLD